MSDIREKLTEFSRGLQGKNKIILQMKNKILILEN